MEKSNEVRCPKCLSNQLSANTKGFSGKKALTGALLFGEIGLLHGTSGSNDVIITCLECGNQFKAGQGRILLTEENQKRLDEKLISIIQANGKMLAVYEYKTATHTPEKEAVKYIDNLVTNHNLTVGKLIDIDFKAPSIPEITIPKESIRKSGVVITTIIQYAITAIFGILTITSFTANDATGKLAGLIFLAPFILSITPVYNYLSKTLNIKLSKTLRFVLLGVLFIIGVVVLSNSNDVKSNKTNTEAH